MVLTPSDLHFLYYLGDYDFVVNPNRLSEIQGHEFSLDPRTGRAVVGTADSLDLIMQCYPDGLIVAEASLSAVPERSARGGGCDRGIAPEIAGHSSRIAGRTLSTGTDPGGTRRLSAPR